MLHDLDTALEAMLRAEIPLPERDVDVSFHAPDRQWASTITRPTVDLFLWDVSRDADEATSGRRVVHDGETWGRAAPNARVRLRYLVTAWTSDARDEHQLLSAVLLCLLRNVELPERFAAGALATLRPLPRLRVGRADDERKPDLWRSLGGELKPAVELVAGVAVDTGMVVPVPAPPRAVDVRRRA